MLCGFEMDRGLLGSCPVSVTISAIYITKELVYSSVRFESWYTINIDLHPHTMYIVHAYACVHAMLYM